MKTIFYSLLFLVILALTSCIKEVEKKQEIQLANTSDITLMDKAVSIRREQLTTADSLQNYPVLFNGTDTIPSQVNDINGDREWDELFLVANFDPKESKTLQLKWVGNAPEFPIRTSARFGKRASAETPVEPKMQETLTAKELPKSLGYQQYQTDGPSWENDKVGFRHYLDGRNAKDLFGKKTAEISPENVGINTDGAVEDNYHVMEDWGRDILSVGNSVGLGGYGLAVGDSLMRLGVTVDDSVNNVEKTTFKILAEGPVNSVLGYDYSGWKPSNRSYDVKERTSIWPGMYGYKNTVSVSGLQGDENLIVGLVNINAEKPLTEITDNDTYVILYTHDKQIYEKEWWLGMALIVPKQLYKGYFEAPKTGKLSNTFLARLKIENNRPVSYYAVAGWELSDKRFKEEAYFVAYVKQLTAELSAQIDIEIKTIDHEN